MVGPIWEMYRQKDCVLLAVAVTILSNHLVFFFVFYFIFFIFGSSHLLVVARNTKLELKAIEPNFDRSIGGLRWINKHTTQGTFCVWKSGVRLNFSYTISIYLKAVASQLPSLFRQFPYSNRLVFSLKLFYPPCSLYDSFFEWGKKVICAIYYYSPR